LHKVKEFMEGKAVIPGATDPQAIAPTPTIQSAAHKVS
jgi:hypothetical protein